MGPNISQNVRITGKAEPLGALEIAGKPVEILADGGFSHDMTLPIGKNRIVIAVKDSAGNLTRRSRSVICMPDERAPDRYDDHLTSTGPKKFVTRSNAFVLSGYTAPNARIDVIREGESLTAGAHTDASGRFRLKLPVTRHQQVLQLRIKVPSGFVTQDEFVLMSDTQPPDLTLALTRPPLRIPPIQRCVWWGH